MAFLQQCRGASHNHNWQHFPWGGGNVKNVARKASRLVSEEALWQEAASSVRLPERWTKWKRSLAGSVIAGIRSSLTRAAPFFTSHLTQWGTRQLCTYHEQTELSSHDADF